MVMMVLLVGFRLFLGVLFYLCQISLFLFIHFSVIC